MNRRLIGKEKSLNDPIKDEDGSEWQDWLTDEKIDQELKYSHEQEFTQRKKLAEASLFLPDVGIEPTATRLKGERSTTELVGREIFIAGLLQTFYIIYLLIRRFHPPRLARWLPWACERLPGGRPVAKLAA